MMRIVLSGEDIEELVQKNLEMYTSINGTQRE